MRLFKFNHFFGRKAEYDNIIVTANKTIKSFISEGDLVKAECLGITAVFTVERIEVIPLMEYGSTPIVIHLILTYNDGKTRIECNSDKFKYISHMTPRHK